MLIGPDAPVSFESKYKASHMAHVYDFYKPYLASEYPVVDGKLSQTCYLMALDSCYRQFCTKLGAITSILVFNNILFTHRDRDIWYKKLVGEQFSISNTDYCVFHSPYNKLVQKSFARLYFNDFMHNCRPLNKLQSICMTSKFNRQLCFQNKLAGQRIIMFSYGSCLTPTMFSLRLREGQHSFSLLYIASVLDVAAKLESRHVTSPEKFVETLKLMEHHGAKDFEMSKDTSLLPPGTFYLTKVDSMYRRFYDKKASDDIVGGEIKVSNGITDSQ